MCCLGRQDLCCLDDLEALDDLQLEDPQHRQDLLQLHEDKPKHKSVLSALHKPGPCVAFNIAAAFKGRLIRS